MVMPSNNTCWLVHYWAGKYGRLGHLYSPSRVENPLPHLPYALDNGAFAAWKNGTEWGSVAFLKHVERYAFDQLRPLWVVVPDVVADAQGMLRKWQEWAPRLRDEYHLKIAFAVQDGMEDQDLSSLHPKPDLCFVGGSTWEWKERTLPLWIRQFGRVHVGRVNTRRQLLVCKAAGAESCDGTGWFRGKSKQISELGHFLREQAGKDDCSDVDRVVYHSRLKHRKQGALPLEDVA